MPENKFPDRDSGTQPDTDVSLMQPSFSQSALVQFSSTNKGSDIALKLTPQLQFHFYLSVT